MRGYTWNNMYLSAIQHAIQGWHANNEVFNVYTQTSPEMATFKAWNETHKTLIVLNGGYASELLRIYNTLKTLNKILKNSKIDQDAVGFVSLPITKFHEEEAALNGALTSVFAVLPETCFASRTERSALFRALARAGIEDPLEAAVTFNQEIDGILMDTLGYKTVNARFKLVSLVGSLSG